MRVEIFPQLAKIDVDRILALFGRPVFFMQLGAFDGVSGDPIFPRITRWKMEGVLIEPQEDAVQALKHNYSSLCGHFVFINAAIAEKDGPMVLYRIIPGSKGPEWMYQLASIHKNILMHHRYAIPNLEDIIQRTYVPGLTFDSVFSIIGRKTVDWLQIDCEGADAELLKLFDIKRRRPMIVSFEHKHLTRGEYERSIGLLKSLGYKVGLSCDSESDTIAHLF